MLRAFMVFQVLAPLIAAALSPPHEYDRAVLHGILGSQAALAGFWVALSTSPTGARALAVVSVLGWFTFVLMLQPHFNGWIVVILGFQFLVTAGVFAYSRRASRVVLTTGKLEEKGLRWQFRIVHLLTLMVAVPVLWGVVPLIMRVPILTVQHIIVYMFVFVMAVGYTVGPLAACWVVYGQGDVRWRIPAATLVIFLAAAVMAYSSYSQTGSARPTMSSLFSCLTQAVFATLSFGSLRWLGFRVGRPAESTVHPKCKGQ